MKLLDKKKIKYGEPCPECGLSWAHGSVKCSYPYPSEPKDYGSTGQTNQKSLDKKKELSKCCNAPIEKLNDWGAEYMGCSKCFSAQSPDKKKTKEYWEDSIKETPTREDVLKSLNELKKTDYSKPVEDKLKEKHSTDKTKELDWEKEFDKEFGILLYQGWKTKMANRNIKSFISSLLQKQRTELLEEILEENFCDLDGTYDYDGIAQSVIDLAKKL